MARTDKGISRSAMGLQSEAIDQCAHLGKAIRNGSEETKALAEETNQLLKTQAALIANLFTTCADMLQQMRTALPPQIERQQPTIFEDAHGRLTPFSVEFINSFAAFQAVLEVRFTHVPGLRKVKELEYAMQDTVSKKALDVSRPWESIFRPGRKVVMSMKFRQIKSTISSCPGCLTEVEELQVIDGHRNNKNDMDTQWFVHFFDSQDQKFETDCMQQPQSRLRHMVSACH